MSDTTTVQETRPPEPPPAPPEVPKPTEPSDRVGTTDHRSAGDTQQSAQQDARSAVESEHAKATGDDSLRPTPEFQARLDEHAAAHREPDGLRPPPELQQGLDEHTAGKSANGNAEATDHGDPRHAASEPASRFSDERAADTSAEPAPVSDVSGERAAADQSAEAEPASQAAGDQATEHVAAARAVAAERGRATGDTPEAGTPDYEQNRQSDDPNSEVSDSDPAEAPAVGPDATAVAGETPEDDAGATAAGAAGDDPPATRAADTDTEPVEAGSTDQLDPVAQPRTVADDSVVADGGAEATRAPEPTDAMEADDRLRQHFDRSEVTESGRAYYGEGAKEDDMREAARVLKPDSDRYTIDMHGNERSVAIGDDTLTPDDLATLMERDPNYDGGPIRLFSCNTGVDDDGFAQQFADRMGVEVSAPTGLAVSDAGTGENWVEIPTRWDEFGNPTEWEEGGEWRVFHPRGDG